MGIGTTLLGGQIDEDERTTEPRCVLTTPLRDLETGQVRIVLYDGTREAACRLQSFVSLCAFFLRVTFRNAIELTILAGGEG